MTLGRTIKLLGASISLSIQWGQYLPHSRAACELIGFSNILEIKGIFIHIYSALKD